MKFRVRSLLLGEDICTSQRVEADEIYNWAAQSFVGVSFEQPLATGLTTGMSVVHILEAIRIVNPQIKFYQASTSEMYGNTFS